MARPLTQPQSPALGTALAVLQQLGVAEPPLSPQHILDGLNLRLRPLPAFDLARLTPPQRRSFGAVRGLLSPADATIYLSAELAPRQEPWIVYHETGHAAIEWHRELLYLDTDYTLSQRVRVEMEREANEFAGHLQFLGPRFAAESRDLPFRLSSALALAERYDASIESSIRRYIETRDEECVCNVFRILPTSGGQRALQFHYFVKPLGRRGHWTFPHAVGQTLPPDAALTRLLNDGSLNGGAIHEAVEYHEATNALYHQQIFSTGHAIFALVHRQRR
jgi:hypothetical protein